MSCSCGLTSTLTQFQNWYFTHSSRTFEKDVVTVAGRYKAGHQSKVGHVVIQHAECRLLLLLLVRPVACGAGGHCWRLWWWWQWLPGTATGNVDCSRGGVVSDTGCQRRSWWSDTVGKMTSNDATVHLYYHHHQSVSVVLIAGPEITHTHTHTHPFNGPLSGTTQVSMYQKVKPIWILL